MELALTILVTVLAAAVGLWIVGSVVGAIVGLVILRKTKKDFDSFDSDFLNRKTWPR